MRGAVFLDRDGVLNEAIVVEGRPHPPRTLAEFAVLPDVPDAVRRLKEAGLRLFVVTNQPDVARGAATRAEVDSINAELARRLPIDAIFVCTHDDADNCDCRKPKPGLFWQARDRYGVDLAASSMVGDRWRDIEAGKNAGCRTVFLDRGYNERQPPRAADFVCGSLGEATGWLLRCHEQEGEP